MASPQSNTSRSDHPPLVNTSVGQAVEQVLFVNNHIMLRADAHVCLGHKQKWRLKFLMSASLPTSDIHLIVVHVSFGPLTTKVRRSKT